MTQAAAPRPPIESGVVDPGKFMHPVMREQYGKWKWHDRPRPGVLHHVAKSGDERVAIQRDLHEPELMEVVDQGIQRLGRHP